MKEKRVRSTCVVMTTHGQLSTSSTSQMTTRERHTRCLQADNRWHIFPIDGEKRTAVLHAKKMADPFFVFHIRSRHLSGLNLSATQEAEKKFWKKKEINNKKKKNTHAERHWMTSVLYRLPQSVLSIGAYCPHSSPPTLRWNTTNNGRHQINRHLNKALSNYQHVSSCYTW